ncbi:MAG: hypothetical protein HC875_02085 [Anaerolineales bacterium]|nr:hypothetical protein [Anaerolineales bacterium]
MLQPIQKNIVTTQPLCGFEAAGRREASLQRYLAHQQFLPSVETCPENFLSLSKPYPELVEAVS